jgi:hypothetical protein
MNGILPHIKKTACRDITRTAAAAAAMVAAEAGRIRCHFKAAGGKPLETIQKGEFLAWWRRCACVIPIFCAIFSGAKPRS